MSNYINIISAIGNNSSVYPLLVRDCGIEVPSKVAMTYNQNLKDSKQTANNALRERFIDEYGTSAIWLGGIPLLDRICNKTIRKCGYNPAINSNLFKESSNQGIKYNIDKFGQSAPDEVKDLKKVLANKSVYEKLAAVRFLISTMIPIYLMGFALPKLNFALTERLRKKEESKIEISKTDSYNSEYRPAFKGISAPLANMSTVNKMAITDGGLTIGRVMTARNRFEKLEMAFKMLGMMFLNFVAPIWIAKNFGTLSNKFFKTNVNLDPKLLSDNDFIEAIKNNNLNLPKGNIIEFLDKNPDEQFSKLAEKYQGVRYLKNRVRDPRVYIDERKLTEFKNEIEKFSAQASAKKSVEDFAKKALRIKSLNILANVALSSFLLAVALPKLTFILRKKVTGSDAEPGLVRV